MKSDILDFLDKKFAKTVKKKSKKKKSSHKEENDPVQDKTPILNAVKISLNSFHGLSNVNQ